MMLANKKSMLAGIAAGEVVTTKRGVPTKLTAGGKRQADNNYLLDEGAA
jgi:hypothetical protein